MTRRRIWLILTIAVTHHLTSEYEEHTAKHTRRHLYLKLLSGGLCIIFVDYICFAKKSTKKEIPL